MKRQVLVVGHADADGHIIAEQVRRNLETITSFEVTAVVDPKRTPDHKAWLHLDAITEVEKAEIVLFVDLMFGTHSFAAEADALVSFARQRKEKRFFVIDHHPLPLRRLGEAPNLRAVYHEDVMDCTVGTPSQMMIIAALCELPQATRAQGLRRPIDEDIRKGMKRASARNGTLSGARLLALLHFNQWRKLAELGREDNAKHPLARGLRPKNEKPAGLLLELQETADKLLSSASSRPQTKGDAMSYDFETVTDRRKSPTAGADYVPQPKDLEAIVTLLHLAAIELTPEPGVQFTIEELIATARELGGDEIGIDPADVKVVLGKPGFLKKVGTKFQMK
ncbi:MAG TPA: hypothetical protein VGG39_08940 [Polyangiaceae bacterium]|jgi:hypothetical protein